MGQLGIQPIRYAQERYSPEAKGMIVSKDGSDLDCSMLDYVDGFEVSGPQPPGTKRKAAFFVDGAWHRVSSDGSLAPLSVQAITADDVLYEGNTAPELSALTGIPGFAHKTVSVAIALQADNPSGAKPAMGLSVKGRSDVEIMVKTELSQVYEMSDGSRILNLDAITDAADGGSVTVRGQIAGAGGEASDWLPLESLIGVQASSIQFRAVYSASELGVSTAKADLVSLTYRRGNGIIVGVGASEAVSVTRDWGNPLSQCHMSVRHSRLIFSNIRAYAAFRERPSLSFGEEFGIGNGEFGTYSLDNPDGMKYDSVKLYFDGARQYGGYEVNSEVGAVSCAAPPGAVITADYEHGWALEEWREMQSSGTVSRADYDKTDYRLMLPISATPRSICAVKLALEVVDGHIDGEQIGAGTDMLRSYPLSRIARAGKVNVYADGDALPAANWSLSEDRRFIRAAAPAGAIISADYDWISETPEVYQFIAAFAE